MTYANVQNMNIVQTFSLFTSKHSTYVHLSRKINVKKSLVMYLKLLKCFDLFGCCFLPHNNCLGTQETVLLSWNQESRCWAWSQSLTWNHYNETNENKARANIDLRLVFLSVCFVLAFSFFIPTAKKNFNGTVIKLSFLRVGLMCSSDIREFRFYSWTVIIAYYFNSDTFIKDEHS